MMSSRVMILGQESFFLFSRHPHHNRYYHYLLLFSQKFSLFCDFDHVKFNFNQLRDRHWPYFLFIKDRTKKRSDPSFFHLSKSNDRYTQKINNVWLTCKTDEIDLWWRKGSTFSAEGWQKLRAKLEKIGERFFFLFSFIISFALSRSRSQSTVPFFHKRKIQAQLPDLADCKQACVRVVKFQLMYLKKK